MHGAAVNCLSRGDSSAACNIISIFREIPACVVTAVLSSLYTHSRLTHQTWSKYLENLIRHPSQRSKNEFTLAPCLFERASHAGMCTRVYYSARRCVSELAASVIRLRGNSSM